MIYWQIPFYKILQHFSSLAGIVFISLFIYHLPQSTGNKQTPGRQKFWTITFVFTAFILMLYIFMHHQIHNPGNIVVAGISAIFMGILLASVISRKNLSSKPNR